MRWLLNMPAYICLFKCLHWPSTFSSLSTWYRCVSCVLDVWVSGFLSFHSYFSPPRSAWSVHFTPRPPQPRAADTLFLGLRDHVPWSQLVNEVRELCRRVQCEKRFNCSRIGSRAIRMVVIEWQYAANKHMAACAQSLGREPCG